jgi:bifunctional non-homologous end joining protein LigD
MTPLKEYARKRDFKKTAEPPAKRSRGTRNCFVVQKHAARRWHHDFRLELDGVLKSWPVPKGIPFAKGDSRLRQATFCGAAVASLMNTDFSIAT